MTLFRLLLLLFIPVLTLGQIAEPAILSLKSYGGNNTTQFLKNTISLQDGGFLVAMESTSDIGTGNLNTFCDLDGDRSIFIKYNSDATTIEWVKCFLYGDTVLNNLFPQQNGENILIGRYAGPRGVYIAKHNASGQVIWSKGYSKGSGAIERSVCKTADGGYLVLSDSYYADSNVSIHYGNWMEPDMWLLKVDSNGTKQWSKVYGGTKADVGGKLIATPDSGCFVIARSESTDIDCVGNRGSTDLFLLRLDKNGDIVWKKMLGGSNSDGGITGCANDNGGILIAGTTASADGDVKNHILGTNFWVINMDKDGNILWENCYGGWGEVPNAIVKAADGSIWVGGYSTNKALQVRDSFGNNDGYLIHLTASGELLSSKVLGSTKNDRIDMLYPLPNNLILAGGYYSNNNGSFQGLPDNDETIGAVDGFLTVVAPWTTGVKSARIDQPAVKMYPNPAVDEVHFTGENNEAYSLMINNSMGIKVHEQVFRGAIILPVSWPAGVYLVRITDKNGYVHVRRLSVRRQ